MKEESTYSKKLRDPRWQQKRLEIFKRDKFKCVSCGNTEKELQVHHLRYSKTGCPWDVEDDSLITTCRSCHEEIEKTKQEVSSLLPIRHFKNAVDELVFMAASQQLTEEEFVNLCCLLNFVRGHPETVNSLAQFCMSIRDNIAMTIDYIKAHSED